jgi:hypothetical protein
VDAFTAEMPRLAPPALGWAGRSSVADLVRDVEDNHFGNVCQDAFPIGRVYAESALDGPGGKFLMAAALNRKNAERRAADEASTRAALEVTAAPA